MTGRQEYDRNMTGWQDDRQDDRQRILDEYMVNVQEQLWLIWRASAVILRTGFCSEILRSFRLRKTLECELQTALVPIFYLGKLYRVCVLSKVCRYFPSVTIVLQLLMKIKTRASTWLTGSDVTARFAEVMTFIRVTEHYIFLCGRSVSVGDPDPQDPHVFGPPGSGSISRRYRAGSGSGSRSSFFLINVWSGLKWCPQNKILAKNLIFFDWRWCACG